MRQVITDCRKLKRKNEIGLISNGIMAAPIFIFVNWSVDSKIEMEDYVDTHRALLSRSKSAFFP
jgi:hypothetical protein